MRALPSFLRKQLETSVLTARRAAEAASRAAIESLGVFADRRPEYLNSTQAALRNGLRAKWRQLGNDRDLLVAECAYEQWHRLLFARFLAENGLLLHPQFRAMVTLAECEELAADLGEPDAWSVAARFAAEILPGIFRLDDPCVRLRLAPEGRHALEQILDAIPAETFAADDALGWVYQFWQKNKKDEVNASERKIGGADLGPVTQLFTENYMVRFLLENSLGAWWVAGHPDSQLVKDFKYLRFDDDGKPAVGTFDGWPVRVAEVTVMDPCCGSGHFLVEAFSMLWRMRVEEEGLAPVEAQNAVLRDNLFGLELDSRCVEIAMFAVALQAWKSGGSWRELPVPNICWSGVSVKAPINEWKKLADGDTWLERALARLHILFQRADTLGSLIDPRRAAAISDPTNIQGSFDDVDWDEVLPLLSQAVAEESGDPASAVLGADAIALTRDAQLLARQFTLVATNVPYLGLGKMTDDMAEFVRTNFPDAKHDLASVFIDRSLDFSRHGGTTAVVAPQSWLYMPRYEGYRRQKLKSASFDIVGRLGLNAFDVVAGWTVPVSLYVLSAARPQTAHEVAFVDASRRVGSAKAEDLELAPPSRARQSDQLQNPDARITFADAGSTVWLSKYAESRYGLRTGDSRRFIRCFWELPCRSPEWVPHLTTVSETQPYAGRENWLLWEDGQGTLAKRLMQNSL